MAGSSFAQSAEQVVSGYLNAVGGVDKLKAIQSVKATGTFQQGGMNIPFVMFQKRPNKQLIEVTFQGMTQKLCYDGTMGWLINPFQGRTTAEKMDADQEKQQKFQADIDGPFINSKEKGFLIEYVGEEDLEGSPVYRIKVTSKEGDLREYYFDKDSYLMVKEKDFIKNQDGSTSDSETNYSDYKETAGILMPFTIENVSEYQGQRYSSFLKMETMEHNIAIDDAMFKMPETAPAGNK
jgi:hypothetical protein